MIKTHRRSPSSFYLPLSYSCFPTQPSHCTGAERKHLTRSLISLSLTGSVCFRFTLFLVSIYILCHYSVAFVYDYDFNRFFAFTVSLESIFLWLTVSFCTDSLYFSKHNNGELNALFYLGLAILPTFSVDRTPGHSYSESHGQHCAIHTSVLDDHVWILTGLPYSVLQEAD